MKNEEAATYLIQIEIHVTIRVVRYGGIELIETLPGLISGLEAKEGEHDNARPDGGTGVR